MATTTPGLDSLPTPTATGTTGAGGSAAPSPEKLRSVAQQFESLFLSQMLNEMRGSMFSDDEDDDDDKASGFGGSPLSDALYSQLSVALGQAGGIGLAQSLMGALAAQAGVDADPSALTGADATSGLASGFTMGVDPADAIAAAAASGADVSGAVVPPVTIDSSAAPGATVSMPGRLSSQYGWRRDPLDGAPEFHKGVDLALPAGSDVPAARGGTVTFAGERAGYGLTVEVSHGNGISTRYAHLSELDVKPGDTVTAGQTIAKSGSTGRSTGPHLHFEVLDDGQSIDPSSGWALLQGAR